MQVAFTPTRTALIETLQYLDAIAMSRAANKIDTMYPDTGPLRRDLYAKHMQFFALGATKRYRMFVGANGIGKTEGVGGYELALHLTGEYPAWWTGKRFKRPIKAWAAGDTNKTLRESIQPKLLGDENNRGTGLIRASLIGKVFVKQNTNGVVDIALVKHVSGGWSRLVLKSYEEGRESFQASDIDLIWLDEEPPLPIFGECVHRFRGKTADGHLLMTFTPARGLSAIVCLFMPQFIHNFDQAEYDAASKACVICAFDEVPHISAEERARKEAVTPPHEREYRLRGLPSVGTGKVYPVEESSFLIDPFRIPDHYPRVFGFDGGYYNTAVVWLAYDPDSGTWYIYADYKPGAGPPLVHAAAIKLRGEWIPGVGDAASVDANGKKLIDLYRHDYGVDLHLAEKDVGTGIQAVLDLLVAGKLKVFRNLQQWIDEFRMYRYDDKQQVVKINDHLMDATRYAIKSGLKYATTRVRKAIAFKEVNFG